MGQSLTPYSVVTYLFPRNSMNHFLSGRLSRNLRLRSGSGILSRATRSQRSTGCWAMFRSPRHTRGQCLVAHSRCMHPSMPNAVSVAFPNSLLLPAWLAWQAEWLIRLGSQRGVIASRAGSVLGRLVSKKEITYNKYCQACSQEMLHAKLQRLQGQCKSCVKITVLSAQSLKPLSFEI